MSEAEIRDELRSLALDLGKINTRKKALHEETNSRQAQDVFKRRIAGLTKADKVGFFNALKHDLSKEDSR